MCLPTPTLVQLDLGSHVPAATVGWENTLPVLLPHGVWWKPPAMLQLVLAGQSQPVSLQPFAGGGSIAQMAARLEQREADSPHIRVNSNADRRTSKYVRLVPTWAAAWEGAGRCCCRRHVGKGYDSAWLPFTGSSTGNRGKGTGNLSHMRSVIG